ncbi:Establishment of cohesion 1 [Mactra antiquata]
MSMLATGSFYNKRDRSFSPLAACRKRRRTTTNENAHALKKSRSRSTGFEFHSSDSGSDDKAKSRSVLSEKNMKGTKHRKSSLEIVKKPQRDTPKRSSGKKVNNTEKVGVKSDESKETVHSTPATNKKFFKSRSPASTDKIIGNIVIKKGFDVKFYPKRGSVTKDTKKSKKNVNCKPKPKSVKSIPATETTPFYYCDFFENDGANYDKGTSAGKQNKPVCNDVVEKSSMKIKDNISSVESDSGLCMSSADTESASIKPASSYTPELFGGENDSDTLSLIDAGSEDLFSSSGRNTPEVGNVSSVPSTPKDHGGTNSSPLSKNSGNQTRISRRSNEETPTNVNLFPIFTRSQEDSSQKRKSRMSPRVSRSLSSSLNNSPLLKYVKNKDGLEQMTIDAGQKQFGATSCDTCGMIYTLSDPEDVAEHTRHHQSLLNVLKFQGWRKERVLQHYSDTGSRVIMVKDDDPNYATKKVEDLNRLMGQELGCPGQPLSVRRNFKAFLYISEDKKIQGCCVTEPVKVGYRVLSEGTKDSQSNHPGQRPWCCSDVPEKVSVGISRIWVYSQARKQGIATKLLDCVRQWSVYGNVIPKHRIAFSDPTPDGKCLASKYFGTPNFLVYKFH